MALLFVIMMQKYTKFESVANFSVLLEPAYTRNIPSLLP